MTSAVLYFDGACVPNPGQSSGGFCLYITHPDGTIQRTAGRFQTLHPLTLPQSFTKIKFPITKNQISYHWRYVIDWDAQLVIVDGLGSDNKTWKWYKAVLKHTIAPPRDHIRAIWTLKDTVVVDKNKFVKGRNYIVP